MREYFPRILGNRSSRTRIGSAIESGRLPHALLLDGAEGSGKYTFAKEIAAALNCKMRTDAHSTLPCGVCENCRRIREDSFVDVKLLEKKADKASIGVSEIKDFRSDMFLSATEAEYRVYIIKDSERLTAEAQNALLTVLEEPPRGVVIMLLADGTDRILTTIRSRVQYIPTCRFTREELSEFLSDIRPDLKAKERVAPEDYSCALTAADGRLGRLISLLDSSSREDSVEMLGEVKEIVSLFRPGTSYASLYGAICTLPQKRDRLQEYLECIMTALGDMITCKVDSKRVPLFFTDREMLSNLTEGFSKQRLLQIYDRVVAAHSDNSKNANITALLTRLASEIHQI